jgi:hypothetical protein
VESVKLVVAGVSGAWFFFHLRRHDAFAGGALVSLCGARLSQDEPVGLNEWGTAGGDKAGPRRWCELCADKAAELGVVLKREALLTMERWTTNRDFDRAFYERFPLLYADWLRPQASSPLWQRGIECGSGWRGIVEGLSDALEGMIRTLPEPERDRCYLTQVKEKWGELRVYMDGPETEDMKQAIKIAVERSVVTCESCGAAGELREDQPWKRVLCDACAAKREAGR